jgi:DNA-binding MarR family transcriptional regulator
MTEHDGVQDEWITMSEAAKRLGITLSKISRLAALNRIETQHNPYDERTKLVNYAELRRMFPPRGGKG